MIRILISIVLFYLSAAIVIATLADLRLNPQAHSTLSGRIKTLTQFFLFAFVFLAMSWLVWPDRDIVTYHRYHIGEVVKSTEGARLKVRIKKELSNKELANIVLKIKRDSSQLKCAVISFYLPEQRYNNQPYAKYISSYDDEIWDKVANVINNHANGIVMRARE